MRIRMWAVLGPLALALLTGCGGQAQPTAPASAQQPAGQSSADPAPDSGVYTKQGTKLSFGEKAVVPFKSSGKTGPVGITVTAIEKGAESDLADLKLGDRAAGMTPYYIKITVSNEDGTDFSSSSPGRVRGRLASGAEAQGVSVIGKFAKCDSASDPRDFKTKGATYQSCALALAKDGAVTGASYDVGSYADQAPGTKYSDAPILWGA